MNSSQRKRKRERTERSTYVNEKIFKEYDVGKCVRCGTAYFAHNRICMDCRDKLMMIWIDIHEQVLRKRFNIEYNKQGRE